MAVSPYPFRYNMHVNESERAWWRLKTKWGIEWGNTWYPLALEIKQPDHVIAFQDLWFRYAIPLSTLRDIIRRHHVQRLWALTPSKERDLDQEIDPALWIPIFYPWETYWTSEKRDWIMYVSHEYSMTVGGEWLLEAIKEVWPQWHEHVYTHYIYPGPP